MCELPLHFFLNGLPSVFLQSYIGKVVKSDIIEIRQRNLAADAC